MDRRLRIEATDETNQNTSKNRGEALNDAFKRLPGYPIWRAQCPLGN